MQGLRLKSKEEKKTISDVNMRLTYHQQNVRIQLLNHLNSVFSYKNKTVPETKNGVMEHPKMV